MGSTRRRLALMTLWRKSRALVPGSRRPLAISIAISQRLISQHAKCPYAAPDSIAFAARRVRNFGSSASKTRALVSSNTTPGIPLFWQGTHDIPDSALSSQRFEPLPGSRLLVQLRYEPGDDPAVDGNLNLCAFSHLLQVGRQVLPELGDVHP